MTQKRRKPPGREGLSEYVVVADGLDTLRDKAKPPKNQPGNLSGLYPIGPAAAETVADLRFRRQIKRIHALGPRVITELLIEIGEQRLCRTYLEQRVQQYSGIDPEHLAALGGDRFPRPPLYKVQS